MTRYRKRNSFQNTIKDYIVPIIGGIFILLILIKVFSGGESGNTADSTTPEENTSFFDINFLSPETEAFIAYPGNSQEQINDEVNFYAGETLTVREGTVSLVHSDGTKINLNKIAEFGYNGANNFSLKSSDAFLELQQNSIVTMRYATINTINDSIISLTQNEAGSTIYVLSGSVKVSNLENVSTTLTSGQKISISRLNASNKEIDLANEKGEIDSFFKSSDWFLDNNGHIILEASTKTDTETNGEDIETSGVLINIMNLRDEMNSDSSELEVSGTINSDDVSIITINNNQVSISGKEFTGNVALTNGINDIVIKIFNEEKDILEKSIYTVYSSATSPTASSVNNNGTTNSVNTNTRNSTGVTTYEVNANDFGFTEPSVTGKYTTTSSEITIRGITTAEGITKVEVNGFELGSFNGSTWRYHAFMRFETLEEGTNQYKVDYFGENNSIVYTDYFTIVKQSSLPATTTGEALPETSSETSPDTGEQEVTPLD